MRSTASKINGRNLLVICVFVQVGLAAFTVLYMMVGGDHFAQKSGSERLSESLHRAQPDVDSLSQCLDILSSNNYSLLEAFSPEARLILENSRSSFENPSRLRLPTVFNFLPHLLEDKSSLRLSYLESKGRTNVSFVVGIPTVKRGKQSYLLSTLQHLISNMNQSERNETLIIVYIGETHSDNVLQIANEINVYFRSFVENGLIDIVAPTPSYYPNFEKLRITLNDSVDRVKWRSKQNLDYAFLMAYAQSKGKFYVQLEDDIVTKPGFISAMKQFAEEVTVEKTPWLVLDFCQLGFIGKMFKSDDLPWLITFFQMFYNDKPVDWLILHFIDTKVCKWGYDCNQERAKYWLQHVPSLFQHIGKASSLKGKFQEAKDKDFGQIPLFFPHQNPPATVKTTIAPYIDFQLQSAYEGKTYFWGILPRSGDMVQFIFNRPTNISKFLFRSGNSENPSDRFEDTTVEVLPKNLQVWNMFNSTSDGFIIVGTFDALGIAEGVLDQKIGAVKQMRLHVHSDSENWAILSEIHLQAGNSTGSPKREILVKQKLVEN